MKTLEYTTIDKTEWAAGPWHREPDKMQWMDEGTRLPCLIVRNPGGALCGYVGVPEGHPWFRMHYDSDAVRKADGEWVEVHGGLTFADHCDPRKEAEQHGVCHVVEEGENDLVWWLGFDCAHSGDFMPKYDSMMERKQGFMESWRSGDTYKDIEYVKAEVTKLALQAYEAMPKLVSP